MLQLHLLFWGGRFGVGILRLQQNISIVNTQVEQSPAASHSSNRRNTHTHTHAALKLLIPMSRTTLHPPSAGAHFPTIHQRQSRLRLGIFIVVIIIVVVGVVILAAIKAFLACLMFILQFKFAFIWSFSFNTTKAMCAYKETKLDILQINVQIAQIRNASKYVQEITKLKEFQTEDNLTS